MSPLSKSKTLQERLQSLFGVVVKPISKYRRHTLLLAEQVNYINLLQPRLDEILEHVPLMRSMNRFNKHLYIPTKIEDGFYYDRDRQAVWFFFSDLKANPYMCYIDLNIDAVQTYQHHRVEYGDASMGIMQCQFTEVEPDADVIEGLHRALRMFL